MAETASNQVQKSHTNGVSAGRRVRTVIRTINATPNYNEGIFTGEDVDNYLSTYINDGWTLLNTHHVGLSSQGINMVYILVK